MKSLIISAAIVIAGFATPASAVTLVTGTNPLAGTTVAAMPNLAGTVVEDVFSPFTLVQAGGTLSGVVQSRVVLAIDNTYDFYWRVLELSFSGTGGTSGIGSFRIGQFGIPVAGLNGDFRTDGLGNVAPNSAFVFASPQEQYINFNFANSIQPGNSSYFMFLDTNATSYGRTALMDVAEPGQARISNLMTTFGVSRPAVPEPATWAMMLFGFGLMGAAMRSQHRVRVRYA